MLSILLYRTPVPTGFLLFHALVEEHVADFVHIKAEAERNRNQGASFHILGCQELTV